jgi:hypothetical protein
LQTKTFFDTSVVVDDSTVVDEAPDVVVADAVVVGSTVDEVVELVVVGVCELVVGASVVGASVLVEIVDDGSPEVDGAVFGLVPTTVVVAMPLVVGATVVV